jgi:hypothetical protein
MTVAYRLVVEFNSEFLECNAVMVRKLVFFFDLV